MLGLLASLYSLYQSRGGDLNPGQFVNLLQSSGGLASSLGSLAGIAPGAIAPIAAGGAASGLVGSGAGAALGTVGAGLGAVGTTMGVGMNLGNIAQAAMSGNDRGLGAPIGSLAGMGIGAGVGTLIAPGVGTLIGAGLGSVAGQYLGALFGQNLPHYYAIREHAGAVGKGAVDNYVQGVAQAGQTGNVLEVQKALGQDFADGRVRVDLNLPRDVAAAIGVDPHAKISDMSPEQFLGLIKAYSERDGANTGWFVGSGDIPYLSGSKNASAGEENFSGPTNGPAPAKALADSVAGVARGTFDTMVQFYKPVLDQMQPVAPLSWESVNGARLAPQIEYQQYNTRTGERGAGAPTWDPASYDTIKQAAQAGTLNDLFMGGGVGLGTPAQRAAAQAQQDEYYRRQTHPWEFDPNYYANLPTQGG